MKISTRGQYSLEALLCLATNPTEKPHSLHGISQKTGISEGYLEQLFIALKKVGLVTGFRGTSGGYRLAKPPREINAYEVLAATEVSLRAVPCLGDGVCANIDICKTRPVWKDFDETFQNILKSTSLEDLADIFRKGDFDK